ncbi:hypothetical protein FS749_007021 [Ceratobasidium sp. UAMH 11750]|nr:hypothetical protein FS749_007021 [Ceratobasidium sp. UAMH 11750]
MPPIQYSPEEDVRADEDADPGYFPAWLGMQLKDERYCIVRKLGWGFYSTVWLVRDFKLNRYAALKIMTRDATSIYQAGESDEVAITQKIASADRSNQGGRHVVEYYDAFEVAGPEGTHSCIVTEVLGPSLENLRHQAPNSLLPLRIVKTSIRQILLGLEYLHTSCGIIHTDLKFDNFILRLQDVHSAIVRDIVEHPPKTRSSFCDVVTTAHMVVSQPLGLTLDSLDVHAVDTVIVDFGNAHWTDHHLREVVQPCNLRAPEVILGYPWTQAVDIWAMGCLTAELLIGSPVFLPALFQKVWDLNEDRLAQMIDATGEQFPTDMLSKSKHRNKFFKEDGTFVHSDTPRKPLWTLRQRLTRLSHIGSDEKEVDEAYRFLKRCLQLQPENRATAKELADDPWLKLE